MPQSIGIIQALLGQQMHIGGIPVDNQSGGDCLAEINTALFIPVHHAHTHLHLAQLLRQKAGDAPGPDHHDLRAWSLKTPSARKKFSSSWGLAVTLMQSPAPST